MSAIIDNNAIQAIFAQPAPDGAFEGDYLKYLRSIGGRRTILFLAFAPKVAGTFFRQAAMHAVNGHVREHSLGSHRATLDVKRIDHAWAAVAVSDLEIVSDHEYRFVVWREAYSVGVG